MHLVECWDGRREERWRRTRESERAKLREGRKKKRERVCERERERERDTREMISGVPPPLVRSEGRTGGMQQYGGTMQQVARRRRRPRILSHRFASFDWREGVREGDEGGMKNAD